MEYLIGVLLGSLITGITSWQVTKAQTKTALITTSEQLETAHRHHREQLQAAAESAKQEIHSRVVLAERMKWIGELRDTIAEHHGLLLHYFALTGGVDLNRRVTEQELAVSRTLTTSMAKLRLLLNPNEEDHQQLADILQAAFTQAMNATARADDDSIPRIVPKAQSILKREWERVKKGE